MDVAALLARVGLQVGQPDWALDCLTQPGFHSTSARLQRRGPNWGRRDTRPASRPLSGMMSPPWTHPAPTLYPPRPAGHRHLRARGHLCPRLRRPQGPVPRALPAHRRAHTGGGALAGQGRRGAGGAAAAGRAEVGVGIGVAIFFHVSQPLGYGYPYFGVTSAEVGVASNQSFLTAAATPGGLLPLPPPRCPTNECATGPHTIPADIHFSLTPVSMHDVRLRRSISPQQGGGSANYVLNDFICPTCLSSESENPWQQSRRMFFFITPSSVDFSCFRCVIAWLCWLA